ncbi:MAG: PqqD family protein [Planctomycetaceae bacterium]|nr:PqqD family protein [Planctomycetaceae bacterium]
MVSFTSKLVKPEGVLVQQVPEGDSVLLHVKSGEYFGLDTIGHAMFQKLTCSSSIQVAYDEILSEYDVQADGLHTDMVALIDELVSHDLLEIVEA